MKIDLVNKSVFNRTKSNRHRNVNADFDPHKYWPLQPARYSPIKDRYLQKLSTELPKFKKSKNTMDSRRIHTNRTIGKNKGNEEQNKGSIKASKT